jgi:hypothetical protein
VREVASRRQVQAHNAVVRLQQRRVDLQISGGRRRWETGPRASAQPRRRAAGCLPAHRKVGGRARVRLHVHAPLGRLHGRKERPARWAGAAARQRAQPARARARARRSRPGGTPSARARCTGSPPRPRPRCRRSTARRAAPRRTCAEESAGAGSGCCGARPEKKKKKKKRRTPRTCWSAPSPGTP